MKTNKIGLAIILCVMICLLLSCGQKKYPYKIVGFNPKQTKAIWYADSFSYSKDTLIIKNSNGYEHKILEPYQIYINER